MRRPKVLATIVILLAIGLHAAPVVFYKGPRQTLWPFLTWAMYKNAHEPGPIEARDTRIVGVTAQGVVDTMTPQLVGLPRSAVRKLYTMRMRQGDSTAARELADRVNQWRDDPFVEIRLEGDTYTVTDTGVVKEASPVISYRVQSSASR